MDDDIIEGEIVSLDEQTLDLLAERVEDRLLQRVDAFNWTDEHEKVALLLAEGKSANAVANMDEVFVTKNAILRWLKIPAFKQEVDRLTLIVGLGKRAARMRVAYQVIEHKMSQDPDEWTRKDLLDWLKYVQSETDGVVIDLKKMLLQENED